MKALGKTYSAIKPETVSLDEIHVWVADNIQELKKVTNDGTTYSEYEYDLTVYSKDEYILYKMNTNQENTDLALAQIVAAMGGSDNNG